jgi:predicted TIM-barrel enzyme
MPSDRQSILQRLRAKVARGEPIVGGAGTGLSAKCEEAGGIDNVIRILGFFLTRARVVV